MTVRSRGLLALSLALLAGASVAAAVLEHDGVGALSGSDLQPGEHVRLRGELFPALRMTEKALRLPAVSAVLLNYTYRLATDVGAVVYVTSEAALAYAQRETVVVSGDTLWSGPGPDGRAVAVVAALAVEPPLVLR